MCKQRQAHGLLCNNPRDWFRDEPIEDRDLALLNAGLVPFAVTYAKGSFLRKVVCLLQFSSL